MGRPEEDGYTALSTSAPSLPNGARRRALRAPGWYNAITQRIAPPTNAFGNPAPHRSPPRPSVGSIPSIAQHVYRTQVLPDTKKRSKPVRRSGTPLEREEKKGGGYCMGHPVHDWSEQQTMERKQGGDAELVTVGTRDGAMGGGHWRPIWEEREEAKRKENGEGRGGGKGNGEGTGRPSRKGFTNGSSRV